MPKCQKLYRRKRQVNLGDLDKCITLQDRNLVAPLFGSTDFDLKFTDTDVVWAKVDTVSGKTYFDGVNGDVNITHYITIRHDVTVTNQTWVEMDGRRIDILAFEDLDERQEFMKLTCIDKGVKVEANKL